MKPGLVGESLHDVALVSRLANSTDVTYDGHAGLLNQDTTVCVAYLTTTWPQLSVRML